MPTAALERSGGSSASVGSDGLEEGSRTAEGNSSLGSDGGTQRDADNASVTAVTAYSRCSGDSDDFAAFLAALSVTRSPGGADRRLAPMFLAGSGNSDNSNSDSSDSSSSSSSFCSGTPTERGDGGIGALASLQGETATCDRSSPVTSRQVRERTPHVLRRSRVKNRPGGGSIVFALSEVGEFSLRAEYEELMPMPTPLSVSGTGDELPRAVSFDDDLDIESRKPSLREDARADAFSPEDW